MSVGIATFSDLVESSPNRIACDIWGSPSCPPTPSTLVGCGVWCVMRGVWCVVPGHVLLLPRAQHLFPRACPSGLIGIGYAHPNRLLSYPDVRYLSGCDGIRGALAPFSRTSPHLGLLLSGVTPLSTVFRAPSGHVAAFKASSPIPHVIPLQLLQTLNLHRWNCNVLRGTRKMTVRNYVRLFRESPVIPL